ncbi:NAD(P)-dependent dehydrogenase, short-chain alcohol dehydrogenase family [Amycolatopsis pretoriensis]|uniref:NAD(P)-dependent dehydrogenase, short-chain alcohol dehydrogenase family n=1 Tax=Amycolatopsis pretoriensis TaxID=218821 RepID=A0A1H5Q542_9PSEU|nr:SDR family oxidoreductase [Amycolatopsis pretoriensis]SEF20377.1 NAD(P)-dependent dehydrogenase, short-chain alcohol dehydrogenase family [Amycolatopsis pretoriensis]
MKTDLGLSGAVVLVTGGVRGVGRGITDVFLAHGAHVVTCARRETATTAEFVQCDVRDETQVKSLIDGIVHNHGRLDVVVNNAGGAPYAPAAEASTRLHDKIVQLNLLTPLLVSQHANAVMQRQDGGGSIVMISSVSGTRASPGTAAYGAAKAGLDNLAASLAVEWAPKVRVNTLDVGMVRTEQAHLHYGSEAAVEAVGKTVPLGRLAEPAEVGACAAFLASGLASYVSGATLLVHGGGEVPAFLAAADVNQREDS